MIALAINMGMAGEVFDVTAAFLSGHALCREVYVRAPPEGLPRAGGVGPVRPYQLLRILKGACGPTEAPRLWYLMGYVIIDKMRV